MLYTVQNLSTKRIVSVSPKASKPPFKPFLLTFREQGHAAAVRERLQECRQVVHTNCDNLVTLSPTGAEAACAYSKDTPGYSVQQLSTGSMALGRDLFIVYDVERLSDAQQQMVLYGTLVEMHDSEFDS